MAGGDRFRAWRGRRAWNRHLWLNPHKFAILAADFADTRSKSLLRTLLIEDHPALSEAIAGGLARAGFAVDACGSVAEAREAVGLAPYDLAILDLGLPDGSGLDLLKEWQDLDAFPTIIMTARGALGDRIAGLDSGADDYIVKPIEIPELVARCRAVLRRPGHRTSVVLTAGNIRLDTTSREAHSKDVLLALGRRELSLLEVLIRRQGKVATRAILTEALYDRDMDVTPNAVDAVVSRLRRALLDAGADVTLKTIRGVGWMLSVGAP